MRAALSIICISFAISSSAVAADRSDPGAALRSLLKRKYSAPQPADPPSTAMGSTLAPVAAGKASPSAPLTDEVLVIRPGGKIKRERVETIREEHSRNTGGTSSARQFADNQPLGGIGGLWQSVRSFWEKAKTPTGEAAQADTIGASNSKPAESKAVQAKSPRRRSSKSFGVVPDTYLLQFKHRVTTAEQIDRLLHRYNLKVLHALPAIGVLYVTRKDAGPSKSSAVRGLAPSSKPDVKDVLNPTFLQELRKEPEVNAATVATTISPKTLPRPSTTSASAGEKTFYWTWRPDVTDDGNWGLKRMRFPSVWHILDSHRNRHGAAPVAMGFLDTGFNRHEHLPYNLVHGLKKGERLIYEGANCNASHGTHVAGIAAAIHGRGRGTDGIVPSARVDAIPLRAQGVIHGLKIGVGALSSRNTLLTAEAFKQLVDYLETNPVPEGKKRVVNISLGFNWLDISHDIDKDINTEVDDGDLVDENKKLVIYTFANVLQYSLKKFEKDTLFVIASGNDSENLKTPLKAKWSSPFGYVGLEERSATFQPSSNFIVVEAVDREGKRAPFSNNHAHVSAPGVDIMSTVGGRGKNYAVCDGTSQAAPHVTALAAIMMELAPEKSPGEIADIIRSTAIPEPTGSVAPRVDALEAVLKVQPSAINDLADLNSDGRIDIDDLRTYLRHQQAMTTVFASTFRYFFDLNENGQVEDNEHWYPRIDLNGSGMALKNDTERCLNGHSGKDLEVFRLAWQKDASVSFDNAAKELKLSLEKQSDTPCTW